MSDDPASRQLIEYGSNEKKPGVAVTSFGAPIDNKTSSLIAGDRGPILLEDFVLIDELAHFDRERIPERVAHAKGAGAFGTFEVTHDISEFCKAKLFSKIGNKCDIAVRFSTVAGQSGSADTVRDVRGFPVKFYTEDGIWDLVGNNTPVFFMRDPILFPSFIHSQKKNPVTNLFSNQGIKWLSSEKAKRLVAEDPDYSTRDLYNAIHRCEYPSWNLSVQIMTFDVAKNWKYNPFDLTKVWPHKEFPLHPIGKLTLNRNASNYFSEIEQLAFNPGNMVPGIEPSPDKMLLGRMFSYPDTHRHRLGANYQQLPVNRAHREITNYQRDGPMAFHNQGGAPNYFPNSFNGPKEDCNAKLSTYRISGDVSRYHKEDDEHFAQANIFWKMIDQGAKERWIKNCAESLKSVPHNILEKAITNFCLVNPELADKLVDAVLELKIAISHVEGEKKEA